MSNYFTISAASKLTGKPEHEIRAELIALLGGRDEASSRLFRIDEFGEWLVHRDLIRQWKPEKPREAASDMQSEMFALLKSQMEVKDSQIAKLQEQMDHMIERIREMNVMLHEFQQQLSVATPAAPLKEYAQRPEEEAKTSKGEAPKEETVESPREEAGSFSEWLKRFR